MITHYIEGANLAQAFSNACKTVIKNGTHVGINREHVQDNSTLELHPASVVITNPQYSFMLMDERAPNPFAQLYETLWVISGSNKVTEGLDFFIPRATNYADDGEHWRAAYGTRLRSSFGIEQNLDGTPNCGNDITVDQIQYIVDTLKNDPSSRRAVMTIWDPVKEVTAGVSKDYPCNIALQFMVRDKKLNLSVEMRSNDILYGFSGINVFEWTFLQSMIAAQLGLRVGWYKHDANSLHVYNNVKEKVERCANAEYMLNGMPPFMQVIASNDEWNSLKQSHYKDIVGHLNCAITDDKYCYTHLISEQDPLISYLLLYIMFQHDRSRFKDLYSEIMSRHIITDMKFAVAHYFNRNTKGVDSSIKYLNLKGIDNCVEEVAGKIL